MLTQIQSLRRMQKKKYLAISKPNCYLCLNNVSTYFLHDHFLAGNLVWEIFKIFLKSHNLTIVLHSMAPY